MAMNPKTQRRRNMRNNPTEPEKKLWHHLRAKQLGIKFRRQHSIGPYIADCYCHELRLVIELDGDSHYSADAQIYDQNRDAYMASEGIRVLRYSNLDVMRNISGVLEHLVLEIDLLRANKKPLP
jgi:very-short-patch-repair endonuclease